MSKRIKGHMREVKACGVLCFRRNEQTGQREFLLMKHDWRWDLPKGHLDGNESEIDCALRELQEETGIEAQDIALDEGFRYEAVREVSPPYLHGETIRKTYVFFVGLVDDGVQIRASEEHIGYVWHVWHPPHAISEFLIDEIIEAYADYEAKRKA
jgi:bis(5'-nucleosidyl)-tetraphosphatase